MRNVLIVLVSGAIFCSSVAGADSPGVDSACSRKSHATGLPPFAELPKPALPPDAQQTEDALGPMAQAALKLVENIENGSFSYTNVTPNFDGEACRLV